MESNLNYFNFKKIGSKILLTNDTGRYVFLNAEEFEKLINNDYMTDKELTYKLAENYFVYNSHREVFVDNVSAEVRNSKSYLFEGTQLHIFILTGECNQSCIYCQASAKCHSHKDRYMTFDTAEKAVDVALQSPSKNLTFEFQGGEPLLNFEVLRHIIKYTNYKNTSLQKQITFNLVSNLIALDENILRFLLSNKVNVSTSIDGPEFLHKMNRPSNVPYFYKRIKESIRTINKLHIESDNQSNGVQAIQTTTKHSLKYSKEIVDEYISLGFNSVFLRPLTPLGFAKQNWDKIGYTPEEYLEFYQKALEYIIELSINQNINISESYATILLRKIISTDPLNFMELRSPCGGSIGQLAYNYDGLIYTCDEGRMLAESGDASFKLGNVFENDYKDLISSPVTRAICISSCLETIPGCSECVYSPYCGICPIFNYVQGGSIFSIMPANYKCKINKGILDFIFSKLCTNDKRIISVFEKWIN